MRFSVPIFVLGTALVAASALLPATAATADDSVVITGVVTDSAGNPVYTDVEWFDPSTGDVSNPALTDSATGEYSLEVPADLGSFYLGANVDVAQADSDAGGIPTWTADYVGTFAGADGTAFAYQSLAPFTTAPSTHDFALTAPGSVTGTAPTALNADYVQLRNLAGQQVAETWIDNGTFEFDGLVPGDYGVYYAGSDTYLPYNGGTVSVASDQTSTTTVQAVRGATVQGIVSSSGKRVYSADVVLKTSGGSVVGSATTDDLGRYSIPLVPSGSYSLTVDDSLGTLDTGHVARTVSVTGVLAGTTKTVNVSVSRAGGIVGKVVSHSGRTLQIAAVVGGHRSVTSMTGSPLRPYTLTNLTPGTYTVYAVEGNGGTYGTATVKVLAGKSTRAATIKLTKATATISGKVSGVTGGGAVYLTGSKTGLKASAPFSGGTYRLRGIVPGLQRVTVIPKGYVSITTSATITHTQTKTLTKGAQYGVVTGTIVSTNGVALDGWQGKLVGGGHTYTVTTDAEGSFTATVPAATYAFSALATPLVFQAGSPLYLQPSAASVVVTSAHITSLGEVGLTVAGGQPTVAD